VNESNDERNKGNKSNLLVNGWGKRGKGKREKKKKRKKKKKEKKNGAAQSKTKT